MVRGTKTFQYFKRKTKSLTKPIKLFVKHRLGWLGAAIIIPYRGFGNNQQLIVNGYVTEDKGLEKPEKRRNNWQNMLAMIKRYSSDEIPGAEVTIEIDGKKHKAISEETGLFKSSFSMDIGSHYTNTVWIPYIASVWSDMTGEDKEVSVHGEILVPGKDVEYAVISDIDDTILISHATQTLRKLKLMLWRNSRTRKPFPGVAEFYRALHTGSDGKKSNPFFYVSSSEWNLYDLLEDFCDYNEFPKGVFLLRELKVDILKFWKSGGGDHQHKFRKIKMLFQTYPDLSFILIGDNGQHDPEIYSKVVAEYPDRVKAIYIRAIKKVGKDERITGILEKVKKMDIPMILVRDTVEAARHAAKNGYISNADIEAIIMDAKEDKKSKSNRLMEHERDDS